MIPIRLLISILKEENHALVRKLSTAEVAHWVERTHRMREIRVRCPMVTELRPRNIKWQDWKNTSFVIFISFSQGTQRHSAVGEECRTCCGLVESIGLNF